VNSQRYNYQVARVCGQYQFFSEGPKGHIPKIVLFELYEEGNVSFYNLCFGDWNEITGTIDDTSITNNGDAEKVLATVAAIIVDFTHKFEDAIIYAEGSNRARTRRYQIGINKLKNEIDELFHVYGKTCGRWERFQKSINYEAFLIMRITEYELILEEPKAHYMLTPKNNNDKTPVYPILKDREVVDMRDYRKEPFFVKKTEAAKKSMKECPVPIDLLRG
jgi:hypothetical protein